MGLRSWSLAGTALIAATSLGALAAAQTMPERRAVPPLQVPAGPAPADGTGQPAGPVAPVPVLGEADRSALMRAVGGPQRISPERDTARNPLQTLQFFGVRSGDTVLEIWPGQGWYTSVLAPYLRAGGGRLIAAHFDASASGSAAVRRLVDDYTSRFARNADLYGSVSVVPFGPRSGPLGPPGSVDVVLTFRNVHNFVAQGWSEKAFADMFAVLKPGGILGIEDHRASPDEPQDPLASDGYVREDFVIQMAEEAGFEFIGRSEINANPRDTSNHPFGVWTLPPVLRSSPLGQPDDPSFNAAPYRAIGESDRMTLRFRKPLRSLPPQQQAAQPGPAPGAGSLPAGRPVDLSGRPPASAAAPAPASALAPAPASARAAGAAAAGPPSGPPPDAGRPAAAAQTRPPLAAAGPSTPDAPDAPAAPAAAPVIPQLPDEIRPAAPPPPSARPAGTPAWPTPAAAGSGGTAAPPATTPGPARAGSPAAERPAPPAPAASQAREPAGARQQPRQRPQGQATARPPAPPPAPAATRSVRRSPPPPPPPTAAANRRSPPAAAARRSPPPPPVTATRRAPPPPPRDPNKPHWGAPRGS